MSMSPLQSALSSALSGIRNGTAGADRAAAQTLRSTLADGSAGSSATSGGVENQASPELYQAVSTRLQARQQFSAGLAALRTADEMLAETVRLV